MALIRYAATVGGLTIVSRLFGLVRDILLASTLSAGMVADAFFVAFKLPNFFRRLFAEGAFNAAFVPIFSEHLERGGPEDARRVAEEALSLLLIALMVFVGLIQAAMPWAMLLFAPGFADEPEKFDLTVTLTRLTFPYLLFISLVSLLGGVLNSLRRFAAVAATPILLNICLIGAMLFVAPRMATPGHALAWGVSVAGMVQFAWLAFECRRAGMALRLRWPRLSAAVRELLRRIVPAAVGAGVVQISLVIDIILASLLPAGSVSYLFYADRLYQLPLGVIGVAVGTALLPLMSRALAAGREREAHDNQNRAIESALLLTVPAACALVLLAEPLIRVLFQRGAFGPAETQATAFALRAYALGLPAYVLVKILTPGYFARADTRTPVKYGMIALALNVVLNLLLMIPMKHAGLALATAIASWVNVALLARGLIRRGHLPFDDRLIARLPRIVYASALMTVALWGLAEGLAPWLDGAELERISALAVLIVAGLAIYALAAHILGAARFEELVRVVRRRGGADDGNG